jgi:hypothetical protein
LQQHHGDSYSQDVKPADEIAFLYIDLRKIAELSGGRHVSQLYIASCFLARERL